MKTVGKSILGACSSPKNSSLSQVKNESLLITRLFLSFQTTTWLENLIPSKQTKQKQPKEAKAKLSKGQTYIWKRGRRLKGESKKNRQEKKALKCNGNSLLILSQFSSQFFFKTRRSESGWALAQSKCICGGSLLRPLHLPQMCTEKSPIGISSESREKSREKTSTDRLSNKMQL